MHDHDTCVLRFSGIVEGYFLSFICDRTGVFLIDTGKNLHKGRFSGTVFSHERMYFTAFYFEVNVIQGMNARKGLINVLHS